MKIHRYTETIPEHQVEHVEFIASDGKVFENRDECVKYEKDLQNHSNSIAAAIFECRKSTYDWYDDHSATLCLLISNADYEYLMEHTLHGDAEQDDFKNFGPGFYLMIIDDYGDSRPTYRLHNIDYYVHLLETEYSVWKQEIESCRAEILKDLKHITE